MLSIIGLVCCLILAMTVKAKSNEKARNREAIANWILHQYHERLYKWERKAMEWTEEQKKPVKVQFD